jgi:hypothetical protein
MPVQRLLEFFMNLLSRSSEFMVNNTILLQSFWHLTYLDFFSFFSLYFGANLYHLFGFLWTQADAFAKDLGYGSALQAVLIKLQAS